MQLKSLLDNLYKNRSRRHLQNDPLSFCHRYRAPEDREVASLIASAFAYGNVRIILRNMEAVFQAMGPSPRRFVQTFVPDQGQRLFGGFKHRFNDGRDLCALLYAIRVMIDRDTSIQGFFQHGYDPDAQDITSALAAFSGSVLALDYSPVFGHSCIPDDSAFRFLFPSPASGSACKRLCMFLRWMIRPEDGIDLGLWQHVAPSKLVIPVDAHIRRIGTLLGFTTRSQADWKMALEITDALRRLDPDDPVKYDFSLCHLGISEGCDGKPRAGCRVCPVAEVCGETAVRTAQ